MDLRFYWYKGACWHKNHYRERYAAAIYDQKVDRWGNSLEGFMRPFWTNKMGEGVKPAEWGPMEIPAY